jgi:hypothetical protein
MLRYSPSKTQWKLVRSGADDHSTRVLARSHHACSDSGQKSASSGVGILSPLGDRVIHRFPSAFTIELKS